MTASVAGLLRAAVGVERSTPQGAGPVDAVVDPGSAARMAPATGSSGMSAIITIFRKFGGPLTKQIRLAPDGSIISDGSACIMAHGEARRETVADVIRLGRLIEGLRSDQA